MSNNNLSNFKIALLALFIINALTINSQTSITDNLHGGRENGIVGKIPGEYKVTPNGQFCYDIPISTISGRGGLTPSLSVSYSSGNSNGLFGYGFDLTGLSVISRSPRNLYNDGIADIIRFDANDRFSLDGQRLQLVNTTGSEREYRTENNVYAKIIATGQTSNPSKFVVYTKDGLIYEYEAIESGSKILFWPLTKVSDTKGNYYTVSYTNYGNNEYVPSVIKYTGNKNASKLPFASITFQTQNINKTPSYISGVRYVKSRAINLITIRYGNNDVKKYSFTYSNKKGKLFLQKIAEQMGNEKLNSTQLTWNNSDNYHLDTRIYNNKEFQKVKVIIGDFNGDGRKDILTRSNKAKDYTFYLYLNSPTGFKQPVPFNFTIPATGKSAVRIEEVVSGDFNGDGYDDIVVERGESPFYYVDYLESQVDSKGQVSFNYKKTIRPPYQLKHKLIVMDSNNDGASDLFIVNSNFYSNSYYALISESNDNSVNPLMLTAKGELKNDLWDYPGCMSLVDFDGDGTFEVLNIKEKKTDGCGSVLYKMSKEGQLSQLTGLTLGGDDYFIIGDFNGDGKTDIITTGDKDKQKWEVNFSTGEATNGHYFDAYSIPTAYFNQKEKMAYAVDVNGDGLSDIIAINKEKASSLEVYINDGTGKSFEKKVLSSVQPTNERRYEIEDFDGTGKAQILSFPKINDSAIGFTIYGLGNQSTDLLSNITDGLNNTIKVNYSNLTDQDVYKRGSSHTYPLISVCSSWPIVSQVTTNTNGGLHIIDYKYEDAKYHKRGRGMLGFAKFKSYDQLTGNIIEQSYDIMRGTMTPLLISSKTYNKDVLLQETQYSYSLSYQNNPNKKEWVYTYLPQSVNEKKYEFTSQNLISSTTTSYRYDSYGNILSNITRCGDRTVTTTSTYDNNEQKWFLGRLKKAEVTKSNPSGSSTLSSEYEYDTNTGLLTKEVFAPGKAFGYVQTYKYDSYGNILSDTKSPNDGSTPRTKTTTYTSDGRFLESSTDCLGFTTSFDVDLTKGVRNSETDINGITTSYEYNDFGELTSTKTPLEEETILTAWSSGHPYAPSNSLYYNKKESKGHPTTWDFYSNLGLLIRKAQTAYDGSKIIFQDYIYDSKNQLTKMSDPYYNDEKNISWNSTEYDQVGRVIKRINSNNDISSYSYDGFITTITDPRGNKTSKKVNEFGLLVESIDAASSKVSYEYDLNDNCIRTLGPRTTIITEYDEVGNKTKMIDPDLGTISYSYDGFGNTISQTDAHGTSKFTYDIAGRLTKEERPDYTYNYEYDAEVKGKLSKESCSNNTSIEYSYDGFGREIQKKENICGRVFTTSTNYDTKYNRINSLTYPSGLQIGYSYTNTGYQNRVFNIENGSTYWQANTVDANNRICSETSGNGIIRWTNYDNAGNITRIQINNLHANIVDIKNRKGSEILGNGIIRQTKNDNVGDITRIQIGNAIDYTYDYDSNNNLISKKDNIEGTGYSYRYDQLNRLEDVYKQDANNKSSVVDYMYYDESGNITYKYGIGNINYQYGTNRISSIENSDYSIPIWDDIKYTSFNKVSEVKQDHSDRATVRYTQLSLTYGPDKERKIQKIIRWARHRICSPRPSITILAQKYYVDNLFENITTTDGTKDLNYIYANGKLVALCKSSGNNSEVYYVHHDYLGSIIAYTNGKGDIIDRTNCDPWGRKLDSRNDEYKTEFDEDSVSDYCFTGHEHIDMFSMINMNGRMYDPYLGRFLSPDPFIQAPDNTQSLNRYAYCLNNPLSLTDPTGYNWMGDTFCAIVGIAVGLETGGLGAGIWGAVIGGACGGASSALANCLINGANLWQTTKSTLIGGFWGASSGAANFGIGKLTNDFFANCALHSISDGTMEALQGGHFEHGLFVGLASATSNNALMSYCYNMPTVGKLVTTSIIGGTVSAVSGGKFANGAMTAAFSFLYNECKHTFGPENIEKIYEAYINKMDINRLELAKEIGGEVANNLLPLGDNLNACALRLSTAMNDAGFKIPRIPNVTLKGADGRNYIVKASYMNNYLRKNYGGAIKYYTNHSKVSSGIPYIDGRGVWINASGHVDVVKDGNWGSQGTSNGYYKIYVNHNKDERFCPATVYR